MTHEQVSKPLSLYMIEFFINWQVIMVTLRWICGFNLKEKHTELRELLGLIGRGRLRWIGHIEHKDDGDWIKQCMLMLTERTRQTGCPKKTWLDCVMGICFMRILRTGIDED